MWGMTKENVRTYRLSASLNTNITLYLKKNIPLQNDFVLIKDRPFFTAALVFSSPSLVPSFAAFTSFCIFDKTKHTVSYFVKVSCPQMTSAIKRNLNRFTVTTLEKKELIQSKKT